MAEAPKKMRDDTEKKITDKVTEKVNSKDLKTKVDFELTNAQDIAALLHFITTAKVNGLDLQEKQALDGGKSAIISKLKVVINIEQKAIK